MVPIPPTGEQFTSTQWQQWFYAVYRALLPSSNRQTNRLNATTITAADSVQSSNIYRPVKAVDTSYSMAPNDCVILADATGGDLDITLPPASGGRAGYTSRRTIRRVDSTGNIVNVLTRDTDTLDNGAAVTVLGDKSKDFDCDGSTKWYTVGAT